MRATWLPDLVTPLTPEAAMFALNEGYARVMGKYPVPRTLAIHVAQSCLETGWWKKIHRYNFTNEKCSADADGWFCCFRCNEQIDGKYVWFRPEGQEGQGGAIVGQSYAIPPGHPQTRFKAFPSAPEGAAAHFSFMTTGHTGSRYRAAWNEAERGDPGAFVDALKAAHFFTADVLPYKRTVTQLTQRFLREIHEGLTQPPPPVLEERERSPLSDDDLFDSLRLLPLELDWDAMRAERDEMVKEKL